MASPHGEPFQPALTTAERPAASPKTEVIKEAKRLEESSLYSSKGHFATARFWSQFHLWVGIPATVLSALAAAFTFSDYFHIAVGCVAVLVAVLSAVATFLNPNEKAASHLNAGNNYDSLCTRARIFWTIECWKTDNTDQALTDKLKDLCEEKTKLNHSCPQIPNWAYQSAKRGIAAGEGAYEVDKK